MNKSVLLALPALLLLSGCGGSGIPTKTVTQTTPSAGSYAANLTAPANSALLVVLQSNGSATVVIANPTGILASGNGSVSGNTLSVSINGTAGKIQVSTTFGAANTVVSQITGSAADSNVSDTLIAGAGQSPFAGTYTASYTGSDSGTANMMITSSGGISGSGKTNSGSVVSFTGSGQLTGEISFQGVATITGGTLTSTFSGSLYVTQLAGGAGARIMGSGTWMGPKGTSGTWSAENIIG